MTTPTTKCFAAREEARPALYNLRVVPGGAELWRITESDDSGTSAIKESEFASSEETSKFLEELRRALVAGGWRSA